ncbi:606_t:CDS:1, partial [Paraglomus occultum]
VTVLRTSVGAIIIKELRQSEHTPHDFAMKKQATSNKGIALKFKKRLSDTISDDILSPTTPSVSDTSSTASIPIMTAGVKSKRDW